MANAPVLINGEEMAWSNVTVNIFGVPIFGITAIEYSDEQEMEDNYGGGNFPVSRGYGTVKAKSSITLLASEDELLIEKAPEGRLNYIPPFDIVVNFRRVGSTKVINHTLKNVQFLGNSREIKQGDKKIEVKHDLILSHINWK